jgi:hypothetical protein
MFTVQSNNSHRPLTGKMKEKLMEIHERELLMRPPLFATTACVSGLYKRGLIITKPYMDESGKNNIVCVITIKGKRWLEQLSER